MTIQYVEVNGVTIPTTEFIRNRETFGKTNTTSQEKTKRNPLNPIQNTPNSDVEITEQYIVQDEEKNTQVEDNSNENKPIEEIVNEVTELVKEEIVTEEVKEDEITEEEQVETIVMPSRKDLMDQYKVKFGKLPSPRWTDEQIYLKVNDLEGSVEEVIAK